MINWFVETFSTSSEQAKLFSIVISAVLAVCLLLLNQWFIARKARKELFITKIEELLTTIYTYERLSLDILSRLFNLPTIDQITLDKMAESAEVSDKLEMLCVLYFPEIHFDSSESQNIILKAHKDVEIVGTNYKHPKSSYSSYIPSTKKLQKILTPLKEETKKLMKNHT
ncbi:hypothetical protein [Psychromonas arctica]|uniref:hypothetical protein n=1 Tax=Psychromonas arctica TaxID=168275 RepID=UPI002FD047DE